MKQQLLLLEDVESLGKKGEIVTAKPGYFRNFLLPKGLATVASPHTLRKQEKLREERAKQSALEKKESEEVAQKIQALSSLEIRVKVDPEGHMYGSVGAGDVAKLFEEHEICIDRKNIQLPRPIRAIGVHGISLKLKEGVTTTFTLRILPEGVVVPAEEVEAPIVSEEEENLGE